MATPDAPTESIYESVRLPLGGTTCIRIIKIQPKITTNTSASIECDFSILDLDNGRLVTDETAVQHSDGCTGISDPPEAPGRIKYHALSYTWGRPIADQMIKLNGTPFMVRDNLWDFLHHAREKDFTGYLWIDAICINQDGKHMGEKNHQVGMMGEIYSRAECVIVWLGLCSDEQRDSLEDFFTASKVSTKTSFKSSKLKPHKRHAMVAFNFMHLPYWSRAWIVQEYYLAHRKEIWYGNFRSVQGDMEIVDRYFSDQRYEDVPALHLWRVQGVLGPKTVEQRVTKLDTFFNLLTTFTQQKCVDERDRLFSMLSLLPPEERKIINIKPDYSKSVTSLFVDLGTRLIGALETAQRVPWTLPFYSLDRLLSPDYQDPTVQLVALDLRSLPVAYYSSWNLSDFDHRCHKAPGSPHLIGMGGCGKCHMKPCVTVGRHDALFGGNFSKTQWQQYVKGLLASSERGDRDLGAKYLRDRYLDLIPPPTPDEETYFGLGLDISM